jgi:urocanate hydratase
MVDFGGTITTSGNGVHGVSVDSKAGLHLDATATLNSSGNTQDGVHLEETSVLTMFNTAAFSGAPGTTMINTHDNGGNGLGVLTGSNFTVIHQAALNSTNNAMTGIQVDNGSSITLIQSTVSGNTAPDVALTLALLPRGRRG